MDEGYELKCSSNGGNFLLSIPFWLQDKCVNFQHVIEVSPLNMIPMTLYMDITPYFNK